MRRTVWTLLFALLLQLVTGGAWAMRTASATHTPPSCHDSVAMPVHKPQGHAAHALQDQTPAHAVQADNHHCCAVGLGLGVAPPLAPLPQAAPVGVALRWASLSTRPDLRPPI